METPLTDWQISEKYAPIDTSGPLPMTLASLQYVPTAEQRAQYVRTLDGSFRLDYVHEGSIEYETHAEHIAHGKLRVFPPGETRETIAKRDADQAARNQAAQDALTQLDAQAAAKRRADAEAKRAKILSELDAENERAAARERAFARRAGL